MGDMNLDEVMIDDDVEGAAIFDLDEEERAAVCTCGGNNVILEGADRQNNNGKIESITNSTRPNTRRKMRQAGV